MAEEAVQLYYESGGKIDAPPLFLLHDFPLVNANSLFPLYEQLSPHYHVITYHPRGSGRSKAPTPTSYVQHLKDMERIVEAISLHSFDIIGEGFGGWLATLFAYHNPHRVGRLILINPPLLSREESIARESELYRALPVHSATALDALLQTKLFWRSKKERELWNLYLEMWNYPSPSDRAIQDLYEEHWRPHLATFQKALLEAPFRTWKEKSHVLFGTNYPLRDHSLSSATIINEAASLPLFTQREATFARLNELLLYQHRNGG